MISHALPLAFCVVEKLYHFCGARVRNKRFSALGRAEALITNTCMPLECSSPCSRFVALAGRAFRCAVRPARRHRDAEEQQHKAGELDLLELLAEDRQRQ